MLSRKSYAEVFEVFRTRRHSHQHVQSWQSSIQSQVGHLLRAAILNIVPAREPLSWTVREEIEIHRRGGTFEIDAKVVFLSQRQVKP